MSSFPGLVSGLCKTGGSQKCQSKLQARLIFRTHVVVYRRRGKCGVALRKHHGSGVMALRHARPLKGLVPATSGWQFLTAGPICEGTPSAGLSEAAVVGVMSSAY